MEFFKYPLKALGYISAYLSYKNRIAGLLNIERGQVDKFYSEINNSNFINEIVDKSHLAQGFFQLGMLSVLRAPTLYVVCRIIQPETVVETGVADGFSSAFILQALEENKKGKLFSIDLPNQPGQEIKRETGWLIPDGMRNRWKLILGSSREKLPALIKDLGAVDTFYHDSDHSYENMLFEFATIWPYLRKGGVLLSDDITDSAAFKDFCHKNVAEKAELFKLGIARR